MTQDNLFETALRHAPVTHKIKLPPPERMPERKEALLALVADSYKRMAINRDEHYRGDQMAKCRAWLEELTQIWESGEIPTKF